ncbi:MAG: DinB family protein [Flavobacteriales bacterium]|nr:DinB family protein [Flavobacteriales bacterium]
MSFIPTNYPDFMKPYFDQVEKSGIINLNELMFYADQELFKILNQIPPDKANVKYQPDKWSIIEVLQHILDTERFFAFRAFCISRNDPHVLHGFDQNEYVENSRATIKNFYSLQQEYAAHHQYVQYFFRNLTWNELENWGRVANYEVSANILGYAIVGHTLHHVDILKQKYLPLLDL